MIIDEIVGYRPFIRRPVYSDRVKPFMGKEIIKVITGQRRVGKSFILFQFIQDILDMLPDAHIIYLNKELKQYEYIIERFTGKMAKEQSEKEYLNDKGSRGWHLSCVIKHPILDGYCYYFARLIKQD